MNVVVKPIRSSLGIMHKTLCNAVIVVLAVISVVLTGCHTRNTTASGSENSTHLIKPVMTFNADSAFSFIKEQVDMGPRVPGTEGSVKCRKWIINKLRQFGADSIIVQNCNATAHNDDVLPLTNIMGRFGSKDCPSILLVAHYDTRPWADREKSHEALQTPIPGANDGGSGVGVMLELARQFSQKRPDIGVDLLFVDGEDYGKSDGWSNNDSTWCLGTQYWVEHMPADFNRFPPRYGIVLDMVGGKHARFYREFLSDRYAPELINKVWQIAEASGYDNYFINRPGGSVIDDHMFISRSGIPTIDIIDCNNAETDNFPASWHTLSDDMSNIDPETLAAVGQTISNVIYREKP